MDSLHYDPLDFYNQNLKLKHQQNVEDCFNELTQRSGIDVEANRKTVARYKEKLSSIDKTRKKTFWLGFLRAAMIVTAVLGVVLSIGLASESPYMPIILLPIAILLTVLVFVSINPKIKKLKGSLQEEEAQAKKIYGEAMEQMAPLNASFDEKMTLSLFEKSMPLFHFSENFTEEMSLDLRQNFDMPTYDDPETSVIATLSGKYNENPFVYIRRLIHQMGTETYHGYRVISWTESYTDSEGKRRTRTRTQTLHAQVVKPKPYYSVDTRLHFGAQAAPDLSFNREGNNINEKSDGAIERYVKRGERKNAKRTVRALSKGESFMAMTNSEFDVLFGATDRNHEVQFRLMFTPLAQTNTVELILSDDTYGDDFDFCKKKRHNVIRSDHAQLWDMNTSPEKYRSYSYDEAKRKFESFNNNYLKSVYFDFAPLLAIPAYQDDLKAGKTPIKKPEQSFANEEYEAMANAIGASYFSHGATRTDTILKANYSFTDTGEENISVDAHSYTTENRIDIIPVFGGDGRMHNVTVPWVEYIPLYRNSTMYVRSLREDEKGGKADFIGAIKDKIISYIK